MSINVKLSENLIEQAKVLALVFFSPISIPP